MQELLNKQYDRHLRPLKLRCSQSPDPSSGFSVAMRLRAKKTDERITQNST